MTLKLPQWLYNIYSGIIAFDTVKLNINTLALSGTPIPAGHAYSPADLQQELETIIKEKKLPLFINQSLI